jgi:hypothetical protein
LTAPAYEAVLGVTAPEGLGVAAAAAAEVGAAEDLAGAWLGVATRVPSGVLTSIPEPSTCQLPIVEQVEFIPEVTFILTTFS